MTQEEKDKKEEQVVRQPAQPAVLPQYAAQTAEAVEEKRRREEGGIYAQLQQRLQTATQNRDRAARRWRDSYEKTGDVMRSFVPKPKDTGDEQRRLKRIALGQAIGQLVGALGAGVVGATTEGWTPAASPAGLYNPAAARLQQLREQEDRDIRDYNNLMAKIQQSLAAGDQAVAEQEFIKAAGDVTNLEKLIADIAQARLREEGLTERHKITTDNRTYQVGQNNKTKIEVAEINAAAKDGKGGSSSDNADPLMMAALLPETKTTTRTNEDGEVITTTSSRSSYSKVEQEAAAALGKDLKQYGVTPSQARRLRGAIENTTATWDTIIYYLQQGYSADYIADLIIGDQSK